MSTIQLDVETAKSGAASFTDALKSGKEGIVGGTDAVVSCSKDGEEALVPGTLTRDDGLHKVTLMDAKHIIEETLRAHRIDPNYPQPLLERAENALADLENMGKEALQAIVEEIKLEAALMDDSPYVEVRAVVPNTDDPEMYVNTFRAWFLGFIFTVIGASINVFFAQRLPTISLTAAATQTLVYPCAKAMEKVIPRSKFWNPGPFAMKEYILLTIMVNVSFSQIYSSDIIGVLRSPHFYGNPGLGANPGFQLLTTLSSETIGFSLAGLARPFLVYPAALMWPSNLAQMALNQALLSEENPPAKLFNRVWTISKFKLFWIVFFVYGLYWVFPQVLFQALGTFNWMTWIAPNNVTLALITGSIGGIGLNPLQTFDYSTFAVYALPLVTPAWASYNLILAMVVIGCTVIPGIFFSNTYNTAYLPINSNGIFDNTAKPYNISRILTPKFELDVDAYENYSGVYYTAGNITVYSFFFAFYTASLVHVGLHHNKELEVAFKALWNGGGGLEAHSDVHCRLMRAYKEVPHWMYMIVLGVALSFAIVAIEVYDTQMPVWGVFFGLGIAILCVIPFGVITAITNVTPTLNVLAELVGGFALPGKPVGNMLFKTYGYITCYKAIMFSQDLKLGHYAKIPPRSTFAAQLAMTVVSVFVQVGVVNWQIANNHDLCDPNNKQKFTCPNWRTFFSASVVWGVVGPRRIFGPNGIYNKLLFGFLAGALGPIIPWLLARRYPKGPWKYIHVPLWCYAGLNFAPLNLYYFLPALPWVWFFMTFIQKRYTGWWAKYNYLLSQALGAGIAIFSIIWFFALQYNNVTPSWWGNERPFTTCDEKLGTPPCVYKQLPPSGRFAGTPREEGVSL